MIYREILRFSAASLASFLLDYGLFALLAHLTAGLGAMQGVVLSNVGARVVSVSFNYTVNRRLVFGSDARPLRSAVQYALLAAGILVGNTVVLGLLVDGLGANRLAAKLVTETGFFLVSWLVQRNCIFKDKGPSQGAGQRGR